MGCNTTIYYGDLIPDATLTASTETTGYEKEFLQDWTPTSKWRGTAAGSTMAIDFGAAVHQAAVWVGGTNATSTSTGHQYGVGAAAAANTVIKLLDYTATAFSEVGETYRYGKYWLTNLADHSEAGKLYVAQYKCEFIDKDIRTDFKAGISTEWATVKGRYGQIHREKQFEKYINSFEIVGMGDTQKEILDETIRNEENVIFWDSETEKAYFGTLTLSTPESMNVKPTGVTWKMSGTFEEAL